MIPNSVPHGSLLGKAGKPACYLLRGSAPPGSSVRRGPPDHQGGGTAFCLGNSSRKRRKREEALPPRSGNKCPFNNIQAWGARPHPIVGLNQKQKTALPTSVTISNWLSLLKFHLANGYFQDSVKVKLKTYPLPPSPFSPPKNNK